MENRMMSATSGSEVESYAYDPANHRVEKKIGTTQDYVYFWGLDGRLLATYSVTGSGSSWQTTIVRYRIYLGKMLAGQTSPGYGNAVPMEDRLGTVTAGYPYGTGIQAGTGVESDVDFATYSKDSMTGFEYANQRYYSARWGRFLSADPFGGSAKVGSSPSWNRFSYGLGDPVNLSDPSGLTVTCSAAWTGEGYGATPVTCTDDNIPSESDGPGPLHDTGPGASIDVSGDDDPGSVIPDAGVPSPEAGGPSYPTSNSNSSGMMTAGVVAKTGTQKHSCASNKGGAIWTGTVTFPLTGVGAFFGSLVGPEGTLPGALLGSMFGFGGTASYVPSTQSVYVGVTIQAGLAINGGSGGSVNVVDVPVGQNPNSIANGQSYSVTYQPLKFAGSTVTKSPGSGGPVVGPSVGSKVPVSGSASYNICLWNCGCGG